MNKIYKVIFNKAKGVYEVVSELAHNQGKVKASVFSKTLKRTFYISVLLSQLLVFPCSYAYNNMQEFINNSGMLGSLTIKTSVDTANR